MMEKNQEIQNIEKSIMNIEDMIFKDFCNNIGISNIRQYEQGNLKYYILNICYIFIYIYL